MWEPFLYRAPVHPMTTGTQQQLKEKGKRPLDIHDYHKAAGWSTGQVFKEHKKGVKQFGRNSELGLATLQSAKKQMSGEMSTKVPTLNSPGLGCNGQRSVNVSTPLFATERNTSGGEENPCRSQARKEDVNETWTINSQPKQRMTHHSPPVLFATHSRMLIESVHPPRLPVEEDFLWVCKTSALFMPCTK